MMLTKKMKFLICVFAVALSMAACGGAKVDNIEQQTAVASEVNQNTKEEAMDENIPLTQVTPGASDSFETIPEVAGETQNDDLSVLPEHDPNYSYIYVDGIEIPVPIGYEMSDDFYNDPYIVEYLGKDKAEQLFNPQPYVSEADEVVATLEVSSPDKGVAKLYLTHNLMVCKYDLEDREIQLTNSFMSYYSMQNNMDLYEYNCFDLRNYSPDVYARVIAPWIKELIGSAVSPQLQLPIDVKVEVLNADGIDREFLSAKPNPTQGILDACIGLTKNLAGAGIPDYVFEGGQCHVPMTVNGTSFELLFETEVTVGENGEISVYTYERLPFGEGFDPALTGAPPRTGDY